MANFNQRQSFGSSRSAEQNQPTSPGLKWFISRGDGILTPLIPVDELPSSVNLVGLPRTMGISDAQRMECLGEYPKRGSYELEEDHVVRRDSWGRELYAPTTSARSSLAANSRVSSGSGLPQPEVAMPPSEPPRSLHEAEQRDNWRSRPRINRSPAKTETSAAGPVNPRKPQPELQNSTLASRPLPPSGVEPDKSKKVYCTHWIKTGECNYTQQGCLYKHEMPDKNTLHDIGFRNIPKWMTTRTTASKATDKLWTKRTDDLPLPAIGSERGGAGAGLRGGLALTLFPAPPPSPTRLAPTGPPSQPPSPPLDYPVLLPELVAPKPRPAPAAAPPQTALWRLPSPLPASIHPRRFVTNANETRISPERAAVEEKHNRMAAEVAARRAGGGEHVEATVRLPPAKIPNGAPKGPKAEAVEEKEGGRGGGRRGRRGRGRGRAAKGEGQQTG